METHAQLHHRFHDRCLGALPRDDSLFFKRAPSGKAPLDLLFQPSRIRVLDDITIRTDRFRIKFESRICRCHYYGNPVKCISNILEKPQTTLAPEFNIQQYEIGVLATINSRRSFHRNGSRWGPGCMALCRQFLANRLSVVIRVFPAFALCPSDVICPRARRFEQGEQRSVHCMQIGFRSSLLLDMRNRKRPDSPSGRSRAYSTPRCRRPAGLPPFGRSNFHNSA